MKKLFLLIFLFSVTLYAVEDLAIRSIKEKWTFEFSEDHEDYQMGFNKKDKKDFSYEDTSKLDLVIPDTYDLRTQISPIQKQGNCGSCWAFSVTATAQDALMLYGVTPSGLLSQQYLVDCATNMYGCRGGTFEAAKFLVAPKGAPTLTDYPYVARQGRCQTKPVAGSILEWHYVGASSRSPSIEEIQKAILEYGEVSVTMGADNAILAYKSGIYNACKNTRINHMVNLVGWDNTEGYWIMRNSWGTNWGENGWGRVKFTNSAGRKCNNLGDEAVFVKVVTKPGPIVPREFSMESANLVLKVSLSSENKLKVEDARKILQPFLNTLEKE